MAVFYQENSSSISIPSSGASTPFPSKIAVSGKLGQVLRVVARLNGVSHTFPADIDVLLVGPGGANSLVMSDQGGRDDVNNLSLTFDQISKLPLSTSPLATGTYSPTDQGADFFPLLPQQAPT